MSWTTTLTPELDIGEGLQSAGLGQYVELFRRLEIGWPLCKLCHENPGAWDELFAGELQVIEPEHRNVLVQQMPKILGPHALSPPLGTRASDGTRAPDRPGVPRTVDPVLASAGPPAGVQVAEPRSAKLPGAREDGTIGLWLEKKSPARGKGWQRRWFVINPDKAQMHYFSDATKEELGDVGDEEPGYVHSKGFLDLSKCHTITSNNFTSVCSTMYFLACRLRCCGTNCCDSWYDLQGHFELHFPTKVVELRVEDKDRASLGVVERIFTGLQLLGCLAPENDAVMRPADKAAAAAPMPSRPAPVQSATSEAPLPTVVAPKPVTTVVPNRGNFPQRPERRKPVGN